MDFQGADISQDGERLAVADSQGVRIFDTTTGVEILFLKVPESSSGGSLMYVGFSPGGNRLIGLGGRSFKYGSDSHWLEIWNGTPLPPRVDMSRSPSSKANDKEQRTHK